MELDKERIERQNETREKASRFRPLRWPLSLYEYGNTQVKRLGIYSPRSRYSLRMARYWFAASEVDFELNRLGKPVTIVDVGCERGITKAFCPERDHVYWVGLDIKTTRPELELARYNRTLECSFDEKLPVEDGSADIAVCLHVLEHLPRPEFTLAEIIRILKPGGILIGATPVVPDIFTRSQETLYQRRIRHGRAKPYPHTNSFSPMRWRKLVKSNNCKCELMCGGHLLRWSDSPLENSAVWIRLNQLWGCYFSALAGEVFVVARKQDCGVC